MGTQWHGDCRTWGHDEKGLRDMTWGWGTWGHDGMGTVGHGEHDSTGAAGHKGVNTGNGTAQSLLDMGDTMAWGNMTVLGLRDMGDIDDMREVTEQGWELSVPAES